MVFDNIFEKSMIKNAHSPKLQNLGEGGGGVIY